MMTTSIKLFANRRSAESQRGAVRVMATVLSFAMFLLGLIHLGSVQSLQKDISSRLSDSRAQYAFYTGIADRELEVRTGNGYYNAGSRVNYYEEFYDNYASYFR